MKRSKTLYLVAIFAWLVAAAGGCLPANAQSFAYVANFSDGTVSAYKIDSTTGALSLVASIATGAHPVSVAVDPSGKFVYVANFGDNTVSAYTINSTTGALKQLSNSPSGGVAALIGCGGPLGQVRLRGEWMCESQRLLKRQRLGVHHR